jgi:hypothetical protein
MHPEAKRGCCDGGAERELTFDSAREDKEYCYWRRLQEYQQDRHRASFRPWNLKRPTAPG